MTLGLEMWLTPNGRQGSTATLRGFDASEEVGLDEVEEDSMVDVMGVWLAEAEFPRLCSLP